MVERFPGAESGITLEFIHQPVHVHCVVETLEYVNLKRTFIVLHAVRKASGLDASHYISLALQTKTLNTLNKVKTTTLAS